MPSREPERKQMLMAVSIVRTVSAKNYHYIAFLVNFSEDGNMVYIQRGLMKIAEFFQAETRPLLRDTPMDRHDAPWRVLTGRLPTHRPS